VPTYPHWDQSQSAWIAPGARLQIPVPMAKAGRLLSVEFEVISGLDVDFDIMLEGEDGNAIRLYGPTRRARGVHAVIEIPMNGDVYVTFDNISAWFSHKHVSYTLCFTQSSDAEVMSSSRMRFGKALVQKPKSAADEDEAAIPVEGPMNELRVAAGTQEEVTAAVVKGQRLNVSFDVLEGRDIDFGIMLLPEGEETPISIYGPSRRATKLQTSIPVPATGTVHLGFDTSYTWISSKLVRYSVAASADELC